MLKAVAAFARKNMWQIGKRTRITVCMQQHYAMLGMYANMTLLENWRWQFLIAHF